MRRYVCRMLPVMILALSSLLAPVEGAQTRDMYGRTVSLPDRITKVVGASPAVTYLLYTIAPDLVGALNLPPDDKLACCLGSGIVDLPIVGGFGGSGGNSNPEVLLAARPDLVLAWAPHSGKLNPKVRHMLDASNLPFIQVKLDRIDDYPHAYEYLGKLLGREARGNRLAAYFRDELQKLQVAAAGIPESERVSVYFAEGLDGLTTVASDSVHGEALVLAGGRNVYRKKPENLRIKPRISIEQVWAFDPDVIIVQERSFFETIYQNSRWCGVRAVRDGRVFLEPDFPFNWMDRPPTFMRLMGAKWLAGILYPAQGTSHLRSEARGFLELFFGPACGDMDMAVLQSADR